MILELMGNMVSSTAVNQIREREAGQKGTKVEEWTDELSERQKAEEREGRDH